VKALTAALIAFAALGCTTGARADGLRYGVADDWPKFHPCGDVWWQSAADIGYQDLRMTVQWDAGTPTVIPFQAELSGAVDCALLSNVRPILAIYPGQPDAIGRHVEAQHRFAQFVALVGQAYPGVQNFIVGNEPNVNRFWQPQFRKGRDAAARDYEHTLAQAYDALKVVRPDAVVWGPAISSRGNDFPYTLSNPSHSPVRFIEDLGAAYRASGRLRPIFDEFDMHPYPPVQDTDQFSKPFPWPQAGAANLGRVKQALWDAFSGTAQPVPAEQAAGETTEVTGGLPIDLDEAGEQTIVTGHETAYTSAPENVRPISEQQQSANHVQLAEIAACDPDVKSLVFFLLIDDPDLSTGFQSGNLSADLTPKLSYDGIKDKIASAHGNCEGGVWGISRTWQHATQVVGAQAVFGGPLAAVGSQIANKQASLASLTTSVTTTEDATYTATLLKVPGGRAGRPRLGLVRAYRRPRITFDTVGLRPGLYRVRIVLRAAANPVRTSTLTSNVFKVSAPTIGIKQVGKCVPGKAIAGRKVCPKTG
jgi:hypothetical protein